VGSNLSHIEDSSDVRRLSVDELYGLADEIREVLITSVCETGGHLGSNLGFVEATVALHYVFDTPRDKIVFDVSHQCYAHKMLTGRKDAYLDPDRSGSVSGFTNPTESAHDIFRTGHTSQGVSLAAGLAKARDLRGEHHNVVCVIGDGALGGGEALEGLDALAELATNIIVVVNDNDRSIAENHGGIYESLRDLRASGGTSANNVFSAFGLDYVYVEEGNDVAALVEAFSAVRDIDHPIVVHIHTHKGEGYAWAEDHPEEAHRIAPRGAAPVVGETYQEITRRILADKISHDPSVVVVNAGAPSSVGLTPEFRRACGSQFVDTGITEQHALAFTAGLAKGGAKPVFMVMATFAQRAFDQFVIELGLNRSPATVLVFGAGFYDIDATHAGTLDVVMTSNIPNITCLAPSRREEYVEILDWAIDQGERPVVIRVPEKVIEGGAGAFDPARPSAWHTVRSGSSVCFLALGSSLDLALEAADLLHERQGIDASVVEALNYSSFDEALLDGLLQDHAVIVTIEAGILCGGFGEKVCRYFGKTPLRVLCYGGKKEFLDRVPTEEFFKIYHFTAPDIVSDIEGLSL